MRLDIFTRFLLAHTDAASQRLQVHFLHWAAWVVYHHPSWSAATEDPLQVPVLRGPTRARRIEPRLKQAVGQEAAKGAVARSASRLALAITRFKSWRIKARTATDWAGQHVPHLLGHCRAVLASEGCLGVVSVSCDATRLGKRDWLWTALHKPALGCTVWCAPQALRGG